MATYEEQKQITIPIVTAVGSAALGETPFEIDIPLASYEPDAAYYEVQNVAGAFLYDASGPTYTDYTDEANDAVAGDVPLLMDVGAIGAGDGFLVGGASKFDFITFEINTIGVGNYTLRYCYWNGTGWTELVVPTDLIYETVNSFKTIDLVRLTLKQQPGDWAAMTVGGKYCYYLFFEWQGGTYTVRPIGDQIWLGVWSVAYTSSWSDTMAIDDTQSGQFYFGASPAWNDNMAIDDTQAGQFSIVTDFIRAWSDIMSITDLTDTEGMQFHISVTFADLLTITDLADLEGLAITFSRSFHDIMEIVDALSLGSGLVVSDVMDITDQGLTFNVGLNLSDIMEIVDQGWGGLEWARAFHDVMTIADTILWRGDYPAPVYLRFSARRPQITIYTKAVKKQ